MNRSPATTITPWLTAVLVVAGIATVGCGGGGSTTGGTGGAGGGGNPGEVIYSPCPLANRVGGFALTVVSPTGTNQGYAEFGGSVKDKVDPKDAWTEKAKAGDCNVMVGPKCTSPTTCSLPLVCEGAVCVMAPTPKSVGTVTVTGLSKALMSQPIGDNRYYASITDPYPPFSPGAAITLQANGGDYPGFTLAGRGFAPVEAPAGPLPFEMGKSFTVTWTPPSQPGATKMWVTIDIAHHGNIAAEIQCDAADTGSFTIPASLVDALLQEGTGGFPAAYLTRRTVDSKVIQSGCVDFTVANTFNGNSGIELSIPGVTSCSDTRPCPTGMTCGPDLKCQ